MLDRPFGFYLLSSIPDYSWNGSIKAIPIRIFHRAGNADSQAAVYNTRKQY